MTDPYGDDDPRSDEQLAQAYVEGDGKAFSIIVERHRRRLLSVARRWTHNEEDAQDILQDSWLKASTSMSTYRAEAKLTTWLHTIVTRKAYDHTHHRSRRELALLDDADTGLHLHPQLVHQPFEQVEHALVLRELLMKLPEHQRLTLILVDLLGHDLRTVAGMLEVSTGTIKSRRSRAREALSGAKEKATSLEA